MTKRETHLESLLTGKFMGKNVQLTSIKVLIVEDDMLLSLLTKRFIERMGHHLVASVDNGKEAVEEFNKHQPDIILMDIGLKGSWNGIETMQEIRKQSSVPVVFLSGSVGQDHQKEARQIGFHRFLKKPIMMDDLTEAFRQTFKNTETNSSSGMKQSGS